MDRVYQGTGQAAADLIHTSAPLVKVVGAVYLNSRGWMRSTHPLSPATTFNDVATASYTDTVFNEPVPGQTTATDFLGHVATGVEFNGSAVITDVESITGTGLSFDGLRGRWQHRFWWRSGARQRHVRVSGGYHVHTRNPGHTAPGDVDFEPGV